MNNPDYGKISLWIAALVVAVLTLPHAFATEEEETYDRYCMAQNIYFESANQSFAGKLAVAHVVINRMEDLQFPNTVCGVIYQAKHSQIGKAMKFQLEISVSLAGIVMENLMNRLIPRLGLNRFILQI